MQHQRSNEIQRGEIPTFLKEHTALPLPPFSSGHQPPAGWERWRASLRSGCSMQGVGAAAAAAAAAVAEALPAPVPSPALAGEDMIDAHRFPLLPRSQPAQGPGPLYYPPQKNPAALQLQLQAPRAHSIPPAGVARRVIDPLRMRGAWGAARSCQPGCQRPSPGPPAVHPPGRPLQPFSQNPNVSEKPLARRGEPSRTLRACEFLS